MNPPTRTYPAYAAYPDLRTVGFLVGEKVCGGDLRYVCTLLYYAKIQMVIGGNLGHGGHQAEPAGFDSTPLVT